MKYPSGRIVGMFGLPCSGKSTIIDILKSSSKEIIAHIKTGDIARQLSTDVETAHMANGNLFPLEDLLREELLKLIEKRKNQGAGIIILDGFPRFDDQVKWLLDNRLAGTKLDGCLIKVVGTDLEKRARLRMRDDQDDLEKFRKKILTQEKMIDTMENMIFRYGIPYYTIINHTDWSGPSVLNQAVVHLTKILGIRK